MWKVFNENGEGRGFLGLADNASKTDFSTRRQKPDAMYSTNHALKAIGDGIKLCLEKKNHSKYEGFDLLIEAPLHCLPNERWSYIQEDLSSAAASMPIREIHVVSNNSEPFGFRIK